MKDVPACEMEQYHLSPREYTSTLIHTHEQLTFVYYTYGKGFTVSLNALSIGSSSAPGSSLIFFKMAVSV